MKLVRASVACEGDWEMTVPESHMVRLRLACDDDPACDVFFEPEGGMVHLRKSDPLSVEVTGPGDGIVEITRIGRGLVVWVWSGAETRAWHKDGTRAEFQ